MNNFSTQFNEVDEDNEEEVEPEEIDTDEGDDGDEGNDLPPFEIVMHKNTISTSEGDFEITYVTHF